MPTDPPEPEQRLEATPPSRMPRREPVPGRLAVLTGMSLAVGAIPLPLLPTRALKQLRGAVAHEVSSRHGLSLSTDAREELARPGSDDRLLGLLRRSAELMARRVLQRLGPLGPLSWLARGFEVYALGHLLDRYLEQRPSGPARIQQPEARRVRHAIDTAVLRALHPATRPSPLMLPEAGEDLRDELTRWFDMLLLGTATLPNYLMRRLEAAFDELAPDLREPSEPK